MEPISIQPIQPNEEIVIPVSTKKPLTDKKIESLKKARVALVKSRDTNRLSLHENALDGVIEKKLNEKLSKMLEEKNINKKKVIVELTDSENESENETEVEEPIKLKKIKQQQPKQPQQQPQQLPSQPQLNHNQFLFNSIFGR